MPPKRERTVQGSCWPCKQRRVRCDLTRPLCRKCILSGAKCCYDKILIRWKEWPIQKAPITDQSPDMSLRMHLNENSLAVGDLQALEYFQSALWPLFTTTANPCSPPIPLAMESQPVLLAVCELAEAHRILRDKRWSGKGNSQCNKRLSCLASVRKHLGQGGGGSNNASLSPLLVAVLLLYFLDGFIECRNQSASTASHHGGVRAIVDHLGGFTALIDMGQSDMNMLLSEFASTDLTRALLDDRFPCFPADIWLRIEHGTVWWEKYTYNGTTMATVFHIMTQISFYRQRIKGGDRERLSMEVVRDFEQSLQPSFLVLNLDHLNSPNTYTVHESNLEPKMQAVSFIRAFQHSALLYLYRAICGLPPRHCLVQQHVQSCVECIRGICPGSKAHNCIVFPLYVMGAHAFTPDHQEIVLERLGIIYECIRFSSVLSVCSALKDLWASPRHDGDWCDMFKSSGEDVLVL